MERAQLVNRGFQVSHKQGKGILSSTQVELETVEMTNYDTTGFDNVVILCNFVLVFIFQLLLLIIITVCL